MIDEQAIQNRLTDFKQRIHDRLKKAGYRQKDIEKSSGVSSSTVSNIFRKDRNARIATIVKYEVALNVDLLGLGYRPGEVPADLATAQPIPLDTTVTPRKYKLKKPVDEKDFLKKKIRDNLKETGLGNKYLADLAGITTSALSYSLTYGSKVSMKRLQWFASLLDLEGYEAMEKPKKQSRPAIKKSKLILPEGTRQFGKVKNEL